MMGHDYNAEDLSEWCRDHSGSVGVPDILGTRGGVIGVEGEQLLVYDRYSSLEYQVIRQQCRPVVAVGEPGIAPRPRTFAVPNPFSRTTTLSVVLDDAASLTVEVFDVGGRRVRALARDAERGVGTHAFVWDGRDADGHVVPAGVYYHRVQNGDRVTGGRMVLTR